MIPLYLTFPYMTEHIASGPVIIEDGKVLLVREQKPWGITPWYFPGGGVEPGESLEEACRREVKEEVGIEIEIIRQLETLTTTGREGEEISLVHYLAKRKGEITPGPDVIEWDWHDVHALPDPCADNVKTIIASLI